MPWDLNLSFGGYEVRDGQSAVNFPIDKPVSDTMENSPLISKLLEIEEYKEIYHKYLHTIVTEYIESGKYEADINSIHDLIGQYVENDPTAFYTYEEYKSSLLVLVQFGKDRAKSVTAQLNGEQPSTSYGTIVTDVDLSLLGTMGGQGSKVAEDRINTPPENKSPMKGQSTNNKNAIMEDKPVNGQEILYPEIIEQVMEIIGNSTDGELTDEEKRKLQELGLDESQIEHMAKKEREFESVKIMPDGKSKDGFEQNNKRNQTLFIIAICCLLLFIGLIFVVKYNRRKYR